VAERQRLCYDSNKARYAQIHTGTHGPSEATAIPLPDHQRGERAYIGLGSNQGNREHALRQALERLDACPGIAVGRVSSFMETDPVGGPPQGRFINAAAAMRTSLGPAQLLAACHQVEDSLGRRRRVRWGPRTIDIDLLLYAERVVDEADLCVPHPRMHLRRFVLEPLCEIAPEAVHPVLHKTVRCLLSELHA